jgi:hypothetical protein
MREAKTTLVLGLVLLSAVTPASAQSDQCRKAVEDFHSAREAIVDTAQEYARCVSDSEGADDCGSEFRELRGAQEAFEEAVSEFPAHCRP